MIGHFYKLYVTTKQAVKEARADARAGRKEAARCCLSYIQNGCVVSVLQTCDFPPALSVDLCLLKWELSQLEQECHPQSACDQTSDIKAIRASLDLIAHYIVTQTKA